MSSAAPALAAGWSVHQAGDLAGAEATYREVLAREPKNANAWCYLGIACHDQKRFADAEAAYREALLLQPRMAVAWSNLANTLLSMERKAEAVAAFDRAAQAKPDYASAWRNKGAVALDLGRMEEAEQAFRNAVRLDPADLDSREGLAVTQIWNGRVAQSIDDFRAVLKAKPERAILHKNLGLTLLLLGQFEEGFAEHEWRIGDGVTVRIEHDAPRWDGSPLAGRTLLIEAEQGMGDTIQFIRYAAEIKRQHAGRVIVACEPPLLPLVKDVTGIDVLMGQNESRPPFDVWLPSISLPAVMKHDASSFPNETPYLQADPARVEKWHSRMAGINGLKIGIAWQGNRANCIDRMRSFPVSCFAPIGNLQGISLISLQKGFGSEQLTALTEFKVHTLGDDFDASGGAFLDTAAVMQNLDLVITADTAIAHLAGALARPVWLALTHVPDWRWGLTGERSRWYPTMRVFRQATIGDWPSVFQRMTAAITAEYPGVKPGAIKTESQQVRSNSTMSAIEALSSGWNIHQAGDYTRAEATYRQVLAAEPQNAHAWCYLGMACHDQRRHEEAETAYRRAIELDPRMAAAWNNLGNTLSTMRREEEALAAFDKALQIRPNYANALRNKGGVLLDLGRTPEAEAVFKKAVAIDPNDWESINGRAACDFWTGRCADAIAGFRKVLETKPDHAETHKNLGIVMMLAGDFKGGFPEYDWRIKNKGNVRVVHNAPLWDGSPLAGRTLLLEAEQGMGDTINFIRYAEEIKRHHEGKVVVACEPQLVPLLTGVPGVDILLGQKEIRPPFDVWAPIMSMPGIMKHDLADVPGRVPYLKADPERVAKWKSRLASVGGLKIGIAWQGSKANMGDRRRSFPLTTFASLAKLHGVTLVNLQKGFGSEQLDALTEFEVLSLGDDFDSAGGAFLDTAAVMQNLDLVLTADTSVAHVAGALGLPVWVALTYVADWRWTMNGEQTPWYPTMRFFRQTSIGDWAGVFQRITEALRTEHPELQPKQPAEYRIASSGFNSLARTRHGLLVYPRHDTYAGKSIAELGELSETQCEIFRQLVRPGATVVEAGAGMGAHTVALARLAGENGVVHAIEPQRILYQSLCANVALNSLGNVHCHQSAVGDHNGKLFVPPLDFNKANNFCGLGLEDVKEGEQVPLLTIDSLNLPRCDFLSVSVAGMELAAIRGASATIGRCRPFLYVENGRPDRSAALIEALFGMGYKLYWHLAQYYSDSNYYGNRQNSFGKLVAVKMLGIHSLFKSDIQGLRPITSPQSDWRSP